MTKAAHLAVSVRYVPLPARELEDRKERLRILLLRGALRWARQQAEGGQSGEPRAEEVLAVGTPQK